ncbi:MAG: aminotransferase class I/II-fold pyridoxal phosphate-dependent enzyme [Fimbriimonadales bacterium]
MRFATRAIHGGNLEFGSAKPVSPPIFQSSTYVWDGLLEEPAYVYSRDQNPNRQALEETVASLEGAKHAVAFGSGMAAISAAFGIARVGDHVLVSGDIYGGTISVSNQVLPDHGIEVGVFDALRPESIREMAKPNTKLLIFETPTNPTLRIADIAAIVAAARELGIVTVVDNTFATPYLQNPLAFGVDIVVHSATKYLGGHSDVVLGVAATNDDAFRDRLYRNAKVSGAVPGPFDSWLVLRGIRTLSARMRVHMENATAVAEYLSKHPKVAKVHYPGLPGHPGHELAKLQMRGFGGMLSAEIGSGREDVESFVKRTRLFKYAASLGGVESLVSWPPKLSHEMLSEAERLERGIPPNFLRFSIGLEDKDDLLEDLAQALG